jgi:hypothetical protein
MPSKRTRLIDLGVSIAAALSAVELCNLVSLPVSRSMATGLLFASSVFGIQRIYSAVVDLLVILFKPASPQSNRVT